MNKIPRKRAYKGYTSYSYIDGWTPRVPVAKQTERVPWSLVPLSDSQEARLAALIDANPVVSLHDHLRILPEDPSRIKEYYATGRVITGYDGLSLSPLDGVIGNQSLKGSSWIDTIAELGMRCCDAMKSDLLVVARRTDDILDAKREGRVAWFPMIEHLSSIGDVLDRLDILYGLGLRMAGLVFGESNMIGGGLAEDNDAGLTRFGRDVVRRMNELNMPIDLSHTGEVTSMDTIRLSDQPVVIGHAGARALWNIKRLKSDDLIRACADKGGLFGIETAPHTTMTHSHPEHDLEAVMEHFEHIAELVGIDHVAFGPDTMFGDHVGLHRQHGSYGDSDGEEYVESDYVKGCENPSEVWWNIPRWMIAHGWSDEDIAKVIGGNVVRLLRATIG